MNVCLFVNRSIVFRILLAAVLFIAVSGMHTTWAAGEGEYGHVAERDVMVAMRDGVKLATDIYLPAKDGKAIGGRLPALLRRTPYNKETGEAYVSYFTSHGYAVVFQDTRGRYKSEGVWHMLDDDGRDGYDTCEWIGKQPWSNGRIGTFGTSYEGGTQHAMAMEKAPNLTTVIPVDAMSNLGYQSMRNAGAFELRFWNWIYRMSALGSRQSRNPGIKAVLEEMDKNRKSYLANLPLRAGTTPLKLAPEYEAWLVEGMKRGANDEFWVQNNIVDYPERYKDIPVYLVGGWYDSWAGNTTANYRTLSKTIKGPVYLIMGPWIHGQQHNFSHGQVSFGRDAAIPDHLAWRRIWFDRWLKDARNDVGKADPFASTVRIFVMGTGDGSKDADGKLNHGGFWRNENEWPLARTKYTKYHLRENGLLTDTPPSERNSSTSYDFDPRNPVPTIGGNISSNWDIMLQGAWDQRGGEHIWNGTDPMPLSACRDILVFQSEPLERDIEVTGEIEVTLWASSSARDTDFTAKLIDVYPSSTDFPGGFDLNIGDGIVRARFRDTLAEERLMEPETVYEFTIRLYPSSNVFKKGHRIRVDISSSNFPRFDVNPNTGEPLNDHRGMITARNTVYHDASRPSHILLPVIPGR